MSELNCSNEIRHHWHVHELPKGAPISLRALKPQGSHLDLFPKNVTFHPTSYDSADALKLAFETRAIALNEAGYNVYTAMNQIRPDFYGHEAVKDADITDRTTILVDFDRVGDTSVPASDAEIDAAFDLGREVEKYLRAQGFPDPFWVHSGNGCHLYYRLAPVPESRQAKNDVANFLKGLATQFNNSVVGIDTSVFNASRITKVIGTVARKGIASEDRPYRIARLV
jgi:hypothetical protein